MHMMNIYSYCGDEQEQEHDFHGAAIIDENGKEIPITEEMVQDACQEDEASEQKAASSESK